EESDHVTTYETYGWKFTQAAELVSSAQGGRDTGYISVGVGDGLTPDSDNLQAVINLISGEINFDPTKKYLLDKTLTVNASFAKGLFGNRATFIVGGDFPALTINGGMVSGDSSPASTGSTARRIGGFRIDGLRAYSSDGVSGVGLAVSGMLHPRITNCDLMYLKTGIKFSNRSRNVIISDNHIYACSNYGIHYDNTCDIHQMNLIGNMITYCQRNVFLDNAYIYNMQITGNDIETGDYLVGDSSQRANIWITATNSYVEDIVIVGNTIEDHWTADNLIKMEGASPANILSVSIDGNSAGNSKKHDIELGGCSGIAIGGQFKNSLEYTLSFKGDVTGLKLSAQGMKNQSYGGLLTCNGAYNLTDISVSGCQVSGTGAKNMIRLTGKPNLTNVTIHGNNMRDNSSETPVIIDAGAVKGLRVDFNNISNSSNTSGKAMSINAQSVSGKNTLLFNSADNGVFTAPGAFTIQGNI
ncbi:right-handed parallel beta-helix repeat-containing protein, partial [Klebsiella pneumoniae]